jgi:hypothetical protein
MLADHGRGAKQHSASVAGAASGLQPTGDADAAVLTFHDQEM